MLVLLPYKVTTVNNKIVNNFKKSIYPLIKNRSIEVEKKLWWLNIGFNIDDKYILLSNLEKFFIKKSNSYFNFYWNLCNNNEFNICLLNVKKKKQHYIIYPLYYIDIWLLRTQKLEIICDISNDKCYIYNIDNWMSKPLVLKTKKYNNMFNLFK